MHRRRRFIAYACTLLLSGAGGAFADDAQLDAPLVTRSPAFAIPFELQAASGQRAEAQLFVSSDSGKSWQLAAKAVAPAAVFDYRAPGDGEYWFVVRTEATTAEAVTSEKPEAELRVVVDSTPPRFDLFAEPAADGTLVIRWKADDAELPAEPLKLSYRFGGSTELLPVETPRSKRQLDKKSGTGELQWRPVVSDRKLTLVAELRDAAGNVVIREIEPTMISGAAPPSTIAAPANLPSPIAPSAVPPLPVRDPARPLMVNSLAFELDYDVQQTAAGNVAKVEIWGTRDDGRSWVLLGLDDDRRTPCSVNVDAEGLYGFAVVVEAAGGLKGNAPKPGDVPEIRVGVDLTQPLVRLTTAEPDEMASPCRLKINWEAQDKNLGPQAVTLSYAASAQGPWMPLAQGIPSSGGHICDFDPQGPDMAYLKIEVRDEAGNVGTFATTTPIPIEKRQVQFSFAGASKPDGTPPKPKWFHVLR
jgi:hypothetical protein